MAAKYLDKSTFVARPFLIVSHGYSLVVILVPLLMAVLADFYTFAIGFDCF
ncbi:hypothetical protein [Apilactobacillus xinyiensis]|uniref:Uncharacterized protein n=1 Tax=Apilactobacillus xinyiensis TaxID=2841032 RepID=A0ABT0I227_9LACO|nr:hypothetical protein [Apilactobacillus xinyiensis]MCK8624773.1 hypothetical protein [Apilactobacillus xinyiensis]MCL0319321.1 hypothetical protein [Apilactobacillus xinyiensis]MCL0329855.1 hypothetical protein [Apilactobacillus xinyiensis]